MLQATRAIPALLLLGVLAGCGGGLFFNIGDVDDDDDGQAPTIALTVNPSSAAAGATVTLTASASDADGIESVTFFRLDDDDARVLLSAVGTQPFQLNVIVPTDATGQVRFVARATDNAGDRADSSAVTVTIP